MLNPGTKIYEYRLAKKISQVDLALRAGVAQANLSNIEKGKRDLTVSTLLRIADALQVKPSQLIDEEPARKPVELTRTRIEKLAEAVLNPGAQVSGELEEIAGLFRQIVPGADSRLSSKKANLAWAKLRQRFSSQEIKGICARVEDARQRAYAKKAN